jgi:hypothetical protein
MPSYKWASSPFLAVELKTISKFLIRPVNTTGMRPPDLCTVRSGMVLYLTYLYSTVCRNRPSTRVWQEFFSTVPSQTRNSLRRLSSSLSMAAKATKPIAKWWYSRSPSAKTLKNASRWHYRQHHQAQEVDESALRKWSNSETWYYYSRVDCMWTCVSWTTMTAELQPKVCSLLMIDWMLIFSL